MNSVQRLLTNSVFSGRFNALQFHEALMLMSHAYLLCYKGTSSSFSLSL